MILAAFAIAGGLAYHLTARASPGASGRFSLATVMDHFRQQVQGARATASAVHRGTIQVASSVTEVRLANVLRATITGEARTDIAYELSVDSSGPDQTAAAALADRTTLDEDDAGTALSLKPAFPTQGRHSAGVVLHVPARLAAHVETVSGGARVDVSHVAAVDLDGIVGDALVSAVAGAVTGSLRNGHLTVQTAGTVNVDAQAADAAISGVRGALTLDVRNGHTHVDHALGPMEIDVTNDDLTIDAPGGPLRIGGTGGRIAIVHPRAAVRVDVRRAAVELTMDQPMSATIFTTDAPLRLMVEGLPAIDLDALSDTGTIDASDVELTATRSEQETRLVHTFGRGGSRVTLRDERGQIVIARAK